MQEWMKSSLLTELSYVDQRDAWMNIDIICLSKLLVTIHIFGIYQKQLAIDKLSPAVWNYAANYYMSRLNRFDK